MVDNSLHNFRRMDNSTRTRLLHDSSSSGLDVIKPMPVEPCGIERRRRPRLRLSWTVYFVRAGVTEPLCATTVNISCEGLYCYFEGDKAPFTPGETVPCRLVLPACDARDPQRVLSLHCRTKVIRVETVAARVHGIAFSIDRGWELGRRAGESHSPLVETLF